MGNRGGFKPGPDPRRGHRKAGSRNARTVEIEEISREIIERRGGVDGLLGQFLDNPDPAVGLRAVQLLLGYAYGTPRQRVSLDGVEGSGIILLRWGSIEPGNPAPAALPDAAPDRD